MLGCVFCLLFGTVLAAPTGEDPFILVGRKRGIDRLNLDGSGRRELVSTESWGVVSQIDYDVDQDAIFYLIDSSLRRCSLTGTNDRLVGLESGGGICNSLHVDRRRKKIYRLVRQPGARVFRDDYDLSAANNKKILSIPFSTSVRYLAVGTMTGKLYWAYPGPWRSIISSDIDGSDFKIINPGDSSRAWYGVEEPRNLVLDETETGLYYTIGVVLVEGQVDFTNVDELEFQIRRVDLESEEEETVITGLRQIYDLWPHGDHLYFTVNGDSVMRCHKSGSGSETLASGFSSLRGITVVQPYQPGQPAPVDGAWSGWGRWKACSATCGTGHRLRVRSCDDPRPAHGGSFCPGTEKQIKQCSSQPCPSYSYILIGLVNRDGGIRRMNLDGTEMKEIIKTGKFSLPHGINYDKIGDHLYYITKSFNQIRRCKFSGEDDELIIDERKTIYDIALRADTQQIYVTTAKLYIPYRGIDEPAEVRRYNYDGSNGETLISGAPVCPWCGKYESNFHDIVVSVAMGKMFITNRYSEYSIFSADLDGGNLEVIRYNSMLGPEGPAMNSHGLALDETARKLYFGVWPDTNDYAPNASVRGYHIHVLTLDEGRETGFMRFLEPIDSLQLHDGRLYFTQRSEYASIVSCDLEGHTSQTYIDGSAPLITHFEDYFIKPRQLAIVTLVDAPWTDWSVWTSCTETCGDGIRTRTRTCTGGQCYGQDYEIQECNEGTCAGSRAAGGAERRNKALCALFTTVTSGEELFGLRSALPSSTEEEDKMLSCKQECQAQSMECSLSLRLYASPAKRLARGEEQVHVFEKCNTKWSNVCCCVK